MKVNYRELGNTGIKVSEIGLGGEWLERVSEKQCIEVMDACRSAGINILDCWMSNPDVRSHLGNGMAGCRDKWIVQGHFGSTWQNGQYVRTRDLQKTKEAFEDLLRRFHTDYIDLGMIHFVDELQDWERICHSGFLDYVQKQKENGIIRAVGLSTHNPAVARQAVESGMIEMMMFSVNPAFDMMPPTENIDDYFTDQYQDSYFGINPSRAQLYQLCEEKKIGITVMKGYAGGRLLTAEASPFGVALTPVQCLHYCLTRPAVSSVLVGFESVSQVEQGLAYEKADEEERDFEKVLRDAPKHARGGQCTYCGHCKPCPSEIDIAMVNKYYDLAVIHSTMPESVRDHYLQLNRHAEDCIGCRACEQRCPFGVKIADRMKQTAELFGK